MSAEYNTPAWMRIVLRLAAVYNLGWGAFAILAPETSLKIGGFAEPARYPELWQCLGMVIGVYGIGYWIAGNDPVRHWPIVFVGFLGKVFGPIGLAWSIFQGRLPVSTIQTIITNDLIWWVPFAAILWHAAKVSQCQSSSSEKLSFEESIRSVRDQHGQTLSELSHLRTTLVLFLRHAGCTFCREALADLQAARTDIEKRDIQITLVHMGDDTSAKPFFAKYGLDDVPRFSDPDQKLYQAFDLELGSPSQLFGFRIWCRGFMAAIVNGHGFGTLKGNGFRMPGVFLIRDDQIVSAHRHRDASERPDYAAFACQVPTTH